MDILTQKFFIVCGVIGILVLMADAGYERCCNKTIFTIGNNIIMGFVAVFSLAVYASAMT